MELSKEQIGSVIQLAEEAGRAILGVYNGPIDVTVKADASPLTQADQLAHRVIESALEQLTPQWPVVSEESDERHKALRLNSSCYWLIDPLDGTKEFIRRNGEFTVNIALIQAGRVRFGVVHVPVSGVSYWGGAGIGAWRKEGGEVQAIQVQSAQVGDSLKVVGSRSHSNDETLAYLARLPAYELIEVGSSLKFCLIAEGVAHLYPRLGPTCEWDTAAAQAVLEGAGGRVETLDGAPLGYSKPDILNPYFIAKA